MIELLVIGFILILVLWGVLTYNNFINLRERIKNSWAQIDVQLKRRADLIPNLVETVKGYMNYERETLTKITEMRSKIVQGSPKERLEANDMLTSALKSLFAVAENYPQLKANENFLHLQEQLTDTENKIATARALYNDSVMEYNRNIKIFPNSIIANLGNFKEETYFETTKEERKKVEVKF